MFFFFSCYSLCFKVYFKTRSILSDISIATLAFFWFPFAWNTFKSFKSFKSVILKSLWPAGVLAGSWQGRLWSCGGPGGCVHTLVGEAVVQEIPTHWWVKPGVGENLQVGLIQASFKLLLLPWVPERVRFCVHCLRVESLFPTALWDFQKQALLAFKAKCSRDSNSPCRTPQAGEPDVELRPPSSLRRISAIVIILLFVSFSLVAWVLTTLRIRSS